MTRLTSNIFVSNTGARPSTMARIFILKYLLVLLFMALISTGLIASSSPHRNAVPSWVLSSVSPVSVSSLGGTTLVIQLVDLPPLSMNPADNPKVFVDGVPATVVSIFQSGRNTTISATMQPAPNPGNPSVVVRLIDGTEADFPIVIFGECPKLWTGASRFTQGVYPNCK